MFLDLKFAPFRNFSHQLTQVVAGEVFHPSTTRAQQEMLMPMSRGDIPTTATYLMDALHQSQLL
jgi:hypothetical protein